ncbi:MAG: hypothetical protein ACP5H7_00195 [Minisyncoccia bacterium]
MKFLKFFLNGLLFIVVVLMVGGMLALLIQGWQQIVQIVKIPPLFFFVILVSLGNIVDNFLGKQIKKIILKRVYTKGKVVAFQPAGNGAWELGIITNEIVTKESKNYVVIFTPTFPTIFTGGVRIIEKEKVLFLYNFTVKDLTTFIITAGAAIKNIEIEEEEKKADGK